MSLITDYFQEGFGDSPRSNVEISKTETTRTTTKIKHRKPEPIVFYVNSGNRLSGTSSDFTYELRIPKDNVYTKCVISNLVLPKSFYMIANGYNTFTLIENGVSVTVTLTIGNYNETSLPIELKTRMDAASPNGYIYTITFPNSRLIAQTGKFTFTVSNNGGIQPSLSFDTISAYEFLGFLRNSTVNFVGNTLTSTNPIYLQSERSLYLHSNMVVNDNDNILQDIYTTFSQPFSSIIFSQLEYRFNSKNFIARNNNTFSFRLSDENDTTIDLNNIDWQFTLIIY